MKTVKFQIDLLKHHWYEAMKTISSFHNGCLHSGVAASVKEYSVYITITRLINSSLRQINREHVPLWSHKQGTATRKNNNNTQPTNNFCLICKFTWQVRALRLKSLENIPHTTFPNGSCGLLKRAYTVAATWFMRAYNDKQKKKSW